MMKTIGIVAGLLVSLFALCAHAGQVLGPQQWLGSKASATYDSVSKTRSKMFKWSLFGKVGYSSSKVHLSRDGESLTVKSTEMIDDKPVDFAVTGKITKTRMRGGKAVLNVSFGGAKFTQELQRAADAISESKGGHFQLPLADAKEELKITVNADGTIKSSTSTRMYRGRFATESGATNLIMNLITRNVLKQSSKGTLSPVE